MVEALRAIPAEHYVEPLTGQVAGSKGKTACPLHDDWNPSFHVYGGDRGWYCHQCETGGDIFNLAGRVWGLDCGQDFPLIVKRLSALIRGLTQ